MLKKVSFSSIVSVSCAPTAFTWEECRAYWLTQKDLDLMKEKADLNSATSRRYCGRYNNNNNNGDTEENDFCPRGLLTCFEAYKQKYLRTTALKQVLNEQERQKRRYSSSSSSNNRNRNDQQIIIENNDERNMAIAEAYKNVANHCSLEAIRRGKLDALESKGQQQGSLPIIPKYTYITSEWRFHHFNSPQPSSLRKLSRYQIRRNVTV